MVDVRGEPPGLRGVGEDDALTDGAGEDRRIVFRQRLGIGRVAP
jgi:hypothetical protein